MEATEKTKIVDKQEISSGVYYIKIEKLTNIIPGQLIALSKKPNGSVRYYSVASGKNYDYWGILYNTVEEGWLTPWLNDLSIGDLLYTSFPFGTFLPQNKPMVWIGTGTGIAPFHSMLTSRWTKDIYMIHGARQKNDFYFFKSFNSILKNRYVPCSSQLSSNEFYSGRLSQYLEKEFHFPDSLYYLCGSSSMVVDVRDILLSKGIEFNKILSEIYF